MLRRRPLIFAKLFSKNLIGVVAIVAIVTIAYYLYNPVEGLALPSICDTLQKAETKAQSFSTKVISLAESAKTKAGLALKAANKAQADMTKAQVTLTKAIGIAQAADTKAINAVADAETALNKLTAAGAARVAQCRAA